MKKYIYFIYPYNKIKINRLDICQQPNDLLLAYFDDFPLDLVSLASIARNNGFVPVVMTSYNIEELFDKLKKDNPSYLVVNVSIISLSADLLFLKEIKMRFPNIKIIVKGFPFLLYNQNAIYENFFIDYIIYGEPELTFTELISGVNEKDILGLCYRDNYQAIKNNKRSLIVNLEELQPINYFINEFNGFTYTIEVSRGTNYNLISNIVSLVEGENIRYHSVENIINQIKNVKEKLKIKNFFFKAFLINQNAFWLKEFCNEILNNNIKIRWAANFSLNNIDEILLKLMKKSGCKRLNIFFETCDEKLLKTKNDIKFLKNSIKFLKKFDFEIVANVRFGYPWDNDETIRMMLDIINKIDVDLVNFLVAVPYPETNFFYYSIKANLINSQLDYKDAGIKALVKTNFLNIDDVNNYRNVLYKKYYLNIKKILKLLSNIHFYSNLKEYLKIYNGVLKLKLKK